MIFSNAFVQWLPNQEDFISNAFSMLNENGIFATQIPLFEEMPANQCIIKAEKIFADKFKGIEEKILGFLMGAALRPYIDRLNEEEQKVFMDEVMKNLEVEYHYQANGKILFPFKRLFLVGQK